jgi:hypothetical protein
MLVHPYKQAPVRFQGSQARRGHGQRLVTRVYAYMRTQPCHLDTGATLMTLLRLLSSFLK